MNTFAEMLKGWESFYVAVSTSAATLIGLLFVALSINMKLLRGKDGRHRRDIAIRTFGDFLFVLMLSLIFLVPYQETNGFAFALFALGIARGLALVRQAWKVRQAPTHPSDLTRKSRDYAFPLLASFGLIAVGVLVLRGQWGSLNLMVGVVAALLVSACLNAWFLLMQHAEIGD